MYTLCLAVGARDKSGGLSPAAAYMLTERDTLPTEGQRYELVSGLSLPVDEVLPPVNGMTCVGFIADDIMTLVHLAGKGWSYHLNTRA